MDVRSGVVLPRRDDAVQVHDVIRAEAEFAIKDICRGILHGPGGLRKQQRCQFLRIAVGKNGLVEKAAIDPCPRKRIAHVKFLLSDRLQNCI